jgi:3-hydroxybutyryl-CoA dehydratase
MNEIFLEDLEVGMEKTFSKTVTEADVVAFADVSGDTNPLHLDEDYASKTMFKSRIAHGMLSAGFISAVFGTKFGPGCIYMSQALRFKAPVRIGDTVTAKCTVKEINAPKKRASFDCICSVGDTVVVDGDAMLMFPSRQSSS